jgi:uncharacterized protein (TIGR00106 family)
LDAVGISLALRRKQNDVPNNNRKKERIVKESVIAELKVLPFGTPTASLSKYVKAVVEIVKKNKDVTYQVTPMATIVQGPLTKVMALVQEIHEVPFKMGVNRVLTSIVIDDRRDKVITMESKVKAVR